MSSIQLQNRKESADIAKNNSLLSTFFTVHSLTNLGGYPNPDRNSRKKSLCSLQNAIWNGICRGQWVNIHCKTNENKTIHSWSCNRWVGGL